MSDIELPYTDRASLKTAIIRILRQQGAYCGDCFSDPGDWCAQCREGHERYAECILHLIAADPVTQASAVLTAAGDTGHMVVSIQDSERTIRIRESIAAETMREQAAEAIEDYFPGFDAEIIRNLPLLPDETAPAPSLCAAPCPRGHDHTCARSPQHCGFHRDVKQKGDESCSWIEDPTDYRALLVAELLSEDREDAAQMLADDPADTWERAYAVWSMESADLERYRRGEVSLPGSTGAEHLTEMQSQINNMFTRLDALEPADRERAQSGGAPRAGHTAVADTEASDG